VIEANRYPLPQIENMSKTTRRIGLGVMGFADALYKARHPLQLGRGCAFGEKVMQVLNDESHSRARSWPRSAASSRVGRLGLGEAGPPPAQQLHDDGRADGHDLDHRQLLRAASSRCSAWPSSAR
jgi:hypothetical protein